MENLLLILDPDEASDDDLNAIFRAAHSIKDGSGTFGFTDMTEMTHQLESLLDRARKRELVLTVEMADALLAAGDILKGQLACHRGQASAAPDATECCARIRMLAQGDGALAPVSAAPGAAAATAKSSPASKAKSKAKAKAKAAAPAVTAEDDEGFGFFDDAPGRLGAAAPATAAIAETAATEAEAADPGYGFLKKHATADGAAYFGEFGQRHSGVSRIDVNDNITNVFMGLQVLRCDVDTVVGKNLVDFRKNTGYVAVDVQHAVFARVSRQCHLGEIDGRGRRAVIVVLD